LASREVQEEQAEAWLRLHKTCVMLN
jgi:hypothetical protein